MLQLGDASAEAVQMFEDALCPIAAKKTAVAASTTGLAQRLGRVVGAVADAAGLRTAQA